MDDINRSSQSQVDEKACEHMAIEKQASHKISHEEVVRSGYGGSETGEVEDIPVSVTDGCRELLDWILTILSSVANLSSVHGFHGHGFLMDWKPNSHLSVW